jgi:hypothetical protein
MLNYSGPVILLFTFSLSIFSPSAFAQRQVVKGYHITNTGDTVLGQFPDYKQWNKNPATVDFIPDGSVNKLVLTPAISKGFNIYQNESYIAYQGTRLQNPITYNTVTAAEDADVYQRISAFLRQIGQVEDLKFYIYRDDLRVNMYYSVGGGEITELKQKATIIDNRYSESNTYKSQLKSLLPDEVAKGTIERLSYTEESLSAFAMRLRNQTHQIKKKRNSNNGFILLGGISRNSFAFKDRTSQLFTKHSYPSKMVPVAGIGYIISINRNFDKMFFSPQLKMFSFRHTAVTYYDSNTEYPSVQHIFKSSAALSLGVQFGYNVINKPHFKWSLLPGAGIVRLVKNVHLDHYKMSATQEKQEAADMNKNTYLLNLQSMAIIRKSYLVWLGYNVPAPVTNFISTKANLSQVQFGLGYKL